MAFAAQVNIRQSKVSKLTASTKLGTTVNREEVTRGDKADGIGRHVATLFNRKMLSVCVSRKYEKLYKILNRILKR